MSFYARITQMSEAASMFSAACTVIGYPIAFAAASALKLAPRGKLLKITAGAAAAQLLLTSYIATGNLTSTNRRSNKIMEVWMKRLDKFVREGYIGNGAEGALLTPLAVVTGSSSGLGMISTENLAACGWKVVMACNVLQEAEEARVRIIAAAQARLAARFHGLTDAEQKKRAQQLIGAIPTNVTISFLDVSDVPSIRSFAAELIALEGKSNTVTTTPEGLPICHDGLRLLMNNAGLFEHGYHKWSKEGVQSMFNVNYAGPSYLTHLVTKGIITPRVAKQTGESDGKRVVPFRTVNLASCANLWALGTLWPKDEAEVVSMMDGILLAVGDRTQTPENNTLLSGIGGDTYGISKLAMMAFAFNSAHASVAAGTDTHVTSFAIHPGGVKTRVFRSVDAPRQVIFNLFKHICFKSCRLGANNQTYMSLALIAEQTSTDALTASVAAAANLSPANPQHVGPLNAMMIPAITSGQFLIDAGEGKGGAVAFVARPAVYKLYETWTEKHIVRCEQSHQ